MKKFFLFLFILLLLAAAGVAVFLATFNADKYRPLVVEKLEEALNAPVKLNKLSLGWRSGIAVELGGLSVHPQGQPEAEALLRVERVSAVVKLMPLIAKSVEIASVVIEKPVVSLIRRPEGIQVEGITLPEKPAGAQQQVEVPADETPQPEPEKVQQFALSVGWVRIKDGQVHYTDLASSPPTDLTVNDLDVLLKNVAIGPRPIHFEVSAAVFSDKQNVQLSGRATAPYKNNAATLAEFRFETDLSRLQLDQLGQAFTAAKNAGISELAGKLSVSVDKLVLDPNAMGALEAKVDLQNGKVALQQLVAPIDKINLSAVATQGKFDLKRMNAEVAGGTVTVAGSASRFGTPQADWSIGFSARGIQLEQLTPAPKRPDQPVLQAVVDADFQGNASGQEPEAIKRSLTGTGSANVTDAVLKNMNVLQEVFRRLSIVPGLGEIIQARLPESARSKMDEKNTPIEPMQLQFSVREGQVMCPQFRVATDTFELTGSGQISLEMELQAQTTLRIEQELSAAIISSINEFRALSTADGRLEFPVLVQGQLPEVIVQPDVNYVTQRVITNKAGDLLGDLFNKVLDDAIQ